MNKKYIAPRVEVAKIGSQNIICASGSGPADAANLHVNWEVTTGQAW